MLLDQIRKRLPSYVVQAFDRVRRVGSFAYERLSGATLAGWSIRLERGETRKERLEADSAHVRRFMRASCSDDQILPDSIAAHGGMRSKMVTMLDVIDTDLRLVTPHQFDEDTQIWIAVRRVREHKNAVP